MGLDMYLTGERFFTSFDGERPKRDGLPIEREIIAFHAWRKHANLHGFIVQQFADGEDNCEPIVLSMEGLATIAEAVKAGQLPDTSGFFFGYAGYDPAAERQTDLGVIHAAMNWLNITKDEKGVWADVYYRASL